MNEINVENAVSNTEVINVYDAARKVTADEYLKLNKNYVKFAV
jgi:hypothetical protein